MSIANELITRGWTQFSYEDERTGKVCLVGALSCSLGLTKGEVWVTHDGYFSGVATLCSLVDGEITDWNDDPNRTFDEVLRVAKEADAILNQ